MERNDVKEFFSFSRKEINGFFVFCLVCLLVIFAPAIYRFAHPPEVFSFAKFEQDILKFRASLRESEALYATKHYPIKEKETRQAAVYFKFNPNGLDAASWRKLGLSDRQIKTIKNFESKGGKFYRKEDLGKMYSISAAEYAALEPYITLPVKAERPDYRNTKYLTATRPAVMVEINSADSAALETLNGIGGAFASRILKYRERLGGFSHVEQLKEVYGLDSSKYAALEKQVRVDGTAIKLINVNTASFDELKHHPYLNFKQINALLRYRKQHGNYTSPTDLKNVLIINDETIRKLGPYLAF